MYFSVMRIRIRIKPKKSDMYTKNMGIPIAGLVWWAAHIPFSVETAGLSIKTAKATNTACVFWGPLHQPKMPASLIKKD